MNKYFVGALIMLGSLLALAAGAQAETGDVVVRINEAFIAGGKALPPGTYTVHRSSSDAVQVLILRGEEPGTSVLLLPTTHDDSRTKQLEVKLTRMGDMYYLTEIATELGIYTLAPPHGVARTAAARDVHSMSSSGSN